MTHSIHGRVAIVTGAGAGLGREHALFLARKGARIVVNDVAREAAEAVAAEIAASGGVAKAFAASVTDESAIAAMVSRTLFGLGARRHPRQQRGHSARQELCQDEPR